MPATRRGAPGATAGRSRLWVLVITFEPGQLFVVYPKVVRDFVDDRRAHLAHDRLAATGARLIKDGLSEDGDPVGYGEVVAGTALMARDALIQAKQILVRIV